MFAMDYVPESLFEAILTSVLEERFPETESLTEHQKKALPELSRTIAHATSNTVNRFARVKELHLNPVVLE